MRGLPRRFLTAAATAAVTASLVVAATPTAAQAHGREPYVKVGYFTQWGIYGRAFPASKLQTSGAASRLTHINYAFSDVTAAGVSTMDVWPDGNVAVRSVNETAHLR